MKVWISKYAFSEGVFQVEVDDSDSDSMVVARSDTGFYNRYFHGEGKDWHRTHEGALQKAEKMRKAKLASLAKQIEKLKKLRFQELKVSRGAI